MPNIDVSEVLLDPDLATTFSVIRRTENVSSVTGLTSIVGLTTDNVVGVITSAGADLRRDDAGQVMGRAISVVTPFALRGSSAGVQPDIVLWGGVEYTVTSVDNYQHFGTGFTQAEAMSMKTSTPS